MKDNNLNTLLKIYENKRNKAEKNSEILKNNIYDSNPDLKRIDDKLNELYLKKSKNILFNKNNNADLDKEINLLKNKKNNLFKKLKITENSFLPNYECKLCNDTGYITNNKGLSEMCSCLKQELININYNKSNIGNLKNENFDTFNINIFSDEINIEKYNSKISPKKNMENIKKISENFINNFDNPDEKNLLFTGNTGLGKTFLTNCIAKELLNRKKTVLYQTAPNMLDDIISYRFGDKELKGYYDNLLNVDLLIIDDLGTESINNVKLSELFNILNTRLLNQNNKITKTLISTNLSLESILNTYDERIISRIMGYYTKCRFFGNDLRLKK